MVRHYHFVYETFLKKLKVLLLITMYILTTTIIIRNYEKNFSFREEKQTGVFDYGIINLCCTYDINKNE